MVYPGVAITASQVYALDQKINTATRGVHKVHLLDVHMLEVSYLDVRFSFLDVRLLNVRMLDIPFLEVNLLDVSTLYAHLLDFQLLKVRLPVIELELRVEPDPSLITTQLRIITIDVVTCSTLFVE